MVDTYITSKGCDIWGIDRFKNVWSYTKTAKKHNEHLLQKDIQISLRRVEHRKMNKIKPIPTARELIAIENDQLYRFVMNNNSWYKIYCVLLICVSYHAIFIIGSDLTALSEYNGLSITPERKK